MIGRLLRPLLARAFRFRRTAFSAVYELYEQGRLDEARDACAAIGDASAADIAFLRGLIARRRGDMESAAVALGEAVARREGEGRFHFAFGEVLAELGRHELALPQFHAAAEAASNDAKQSHDAFVAAGRSAAVLGEPARAAEYFACALRIAPRTADTELLLATSLYKAGRIDDARAALDGAIRGGKPGIRLRRALMLPEVYASQAEIDAVRERLSGDLDEILASREPRVHDPATEISLTAFRVAYHNRNNAELLAKLGRAVRGCYPAAREASRRRGGGRLRIGFVSTYFHLHSIGRTTIGLIRDFPRDRFEVHVFAIAPSEDAMRRAIADAADVYYELPPVLDAVRHAIERAELDVLLYPDIGMHPLTYFLAFWRLAPVQAVTWGHPETTGIDTIDCYLSARGIETEGAAAHYTETLVRPDAFYLPGYEAPMLERALAREELGLPRQARLYACLQTPFKLHPDFDAVLAGILARDPAGEVLLMGSKSVAALLRARFERTLGANGKRVRFLPAMPQPRYHATLAAADVALDPLYFGGNNSSCEALALGIPHVTLPGDHLYGRYTYALYREIGIERCVARTIEEYVDVACRIAGERGERGERDELGRRLAAQSGEVFGRRDITLAYADYLEQAVEHA